MFGKEAAIVDSDDVVVKTLLVVKPISSLVILYAAFSSVLTEYQNIYVPLGSVMPLASKGLLVKGYLKMVDVPSLSDADPPLTSTKLLSKVPPK